MGSFPETCVMIYEMVLVRQICLTIQTFFTLVIIFYILITFMCGLAVTSLGENGC